MSVYRPETVSISPDRDHVVIVQFPARARLAVAAKLEAAGKVIGGVLMDFHGANLSPNPDFMVLHGYATFWITCMNAEQATHLVQELRRVYNVAA